jgi:hypothetical protein
MHIFLAGQISTPTAVHIFFHGTSYVPLFFFNLRTGHNLSTVYFHFFVGNSESCLSIALNTFWGEENTGKWIVFTMNRILSLLEQETVDQ